MICELIQKRLSAYIDRQLPLFEKAEVSRHLEACTDCANDVSSLVKIKQLLRTQLLPVLPDAAREAIEQETIYKPTRWQRLGPRLAWSLPPLTAAVAGAWFLFHSHQVRQARFEQAYLTGSHLQRMARHPRVAMYPSHDLMNDTHITKGD